jgi:hypothetical protein
MLDMKDHPDRIRFLFKGIKTNDVDFDVLGSVRAATLAEALELARPIFAEFRGKYRRINVEFTVEEEQ